MARMQAKTPLRIIVMIVTVIAAIAVFLVSRASAEATLTVTPNTHLSDTASVQVSASDFLINGATAEIFECKTAGGVDHCKLIGTAPYSISDSSFGPTTVTVNKFFTDDGGAFQNCESGTGCYVRAEGTDGTGTLDTNISFVPTVQTGQLVVTPNSNLGDTQSVSVTGTGFTPNDTVVFRQCETAATNNILCTAPFGSVTTNGEGGFSTTVTVTALYTRSLGGNAVDCRTNNQCTLRASDTHSQVVNAPLSFATEGSTTTSTSTTTTSTTTSSTTSTTLVPTTTSTTLAPTTTTTTRPLTAIEQAKCAATMAQRQTIISNYQTSYNRQTTDAGRAAVVKSYDSAIKANDTALAANHCPPAPPAPPLGPTQTVAAQTYTVQPGDNLSLLARRLLGDGARYGVIAQANPTITNPSLIRPGQVLVIPSA